MHGALQIDSAVWDGISRTADPPVRRKIGKYESEARQQEFWYQITYAPLYIEYDRRTMLSGAADLGLLVPLWARDPENIGGLSCIRVLAC